MLDAGHQIPRPMLDAAGLRMTGLWRWQSGCRGGAPRVSPSADYFEDVPAFVRVRTE